MGRGSHKNEVGCGEAGWRVPCGVGVSMCRVLVIGVVEFFGVSSVSFGVVLYV